MAVAVFIGIVGHAVSSAGRIPFLEGSATETVIVRLSDLLSSYGLPACHCGRLYSGRYSGGYHVHGGLSAFGGGLRVF